MSDSNATENQASNDLDVGTDYDVLRLAADKAFSEAREGAEVPISLGRWSKDHFLRLEEDFPRTHFSSSGDQLYYDGDHAQRGRGLMLREVRDTITLFCPKTVGEGKHTIKYGPDTKIADEAFCYPCTAPARTVVQISWANESLATLEKNLRRASSAGYNALTVKGWWKGISGNATALASQQKFDLSHAYIREHTSVLVMSKAAGANTPLSVWSLGDVPVDNLTVEAGPVAWLDSNWFEDSSGRFPLPLASIASRLGLAMFKDLVPANDADWWGATDRAVRQRALRDAILTDLALPLDQRAELLDRTDRLM